MQRNTLPAYMTAALLPLLHYDAYAAPAYASPARSHSAKIEIQRMDPPENPAFKIILPVHKLHGPGQRKRRMRPPLLMV